MPIAPLLVSLALAGCGSDAAWSWRQPRPVAPPPASRLPPLPVPAQAPTGQVHEPRRAPPEGPPTYRYGVPLEPPDGRILHGQGQWQAGNRNYERILGDAAIAPASTLMFLTLGEWPRPWATRLDTLEILVRREVEAGRVPHLSLQLHALDEERNVEVPIDREIAEGHRYDGNIRDIGRALAKVGVPAFIRIGGEFSGEWSAYTPWQYPRAYRRIVELFREEGYTQGAYVWCWEASSPGDFDAQDDRGWKWFPGDDVVDWFGLDVFQAFDLSPPVGRSAYAERAENIQRFLAMSESRHRPMMLAETSAVKVGITPDEADGRRDWDTWFEPYFGFMARHPGIKAFYYINTDWLADSGAQRNGWQDADISHNEWLSKRYAEELHSPVYLHRPEVSLLRGWQAPPPADKAQAPPGRGAAGPPQR